MKLRPYQVDAVRRVLSDLSARPLAVLPTGAGKSAVIAALAQAHGGRVLIVAHRQEIIRQLSQALAALGVGRRVSVASVDTLIRHPSAPCDLLIFDEAHHCLSNNKWGRVITDRPGAAVAGLTATPERADGRALDIWGRLIEVVTAEELIKAGYLQRPVVYAPVASAVGIVGDVVEHYLRLAPGALGMTFAVDVAHGETLLRAYQSWGIPAALVTADVGRRDRADVLARFRARELLQLINVDLYGEGTDVPGLEVVSLARPTQSLAVHRQQCGRVMRPGGRCCLIIDHVGNTLQHGLPFNARSWSLNGCRASGRALYTLRACVACTAVHDRALNACPYCGHVPEPQARTCPADVEGDLVQLDPAILAALQQEVARIDGPGYFGHLHGRAAGAARKRHQQRQQAQRVLRQLIAGRMSTGEDPRTAQRRFWLETGIDVLSARTLGRGPALALARRLAHDQHRPDVSLPGRT